MAIQPEFWRVPGIPTDQLHADCVNLQWNNQANVGLLQIPAVSNLPAVSRYVKLETLFTAGLAHIRNTDADNHPMEWIDMLQGVGVLIGHNQREQAVFYLKPAHQRIIRYGELALDVLVPATILGATWTSGNFNDAFVFVVKEMAPAVKVIPWPWGNVYERGKICWGNAVRPRLTPSTIKQLEPAFWETPFNRDLLYNYSIKNWVSGGAPKPEEPFDLINGRLECHFDRKIVQEWIRQEV